MIFWLFLVLSSLFLSQGASTQVNVLLAPAAITVEQTLQPGRSYRLPPATVSSYGTEEIKIEMTYTATTPGGSLHIRPQKFLLQPGRQRQVSLYLELSRVLPPGHHIVRLLAQPETKGDIGLQLAVPIDFMVGEEAVLSSAGIFTWPLLVSLIFLFLSYVWYRKSLGAK